jgi:hypothetical protein
VIKREDLELTYASSGEPDAIGVEISSRGDLIFEIWFLENGQRSMKFSRVDGEEFDVTDLVELITQCCAELEDWAANLRKPGGAWSEECGENEK